MRLSVVMPLAILLLSMTAEAESNVCDIALTQGSFNELSSPISEDLVEAKKAELCYKTYPSISEARSSARRAGFSLGYKTLSIDPAKALKTGDGQWNIAGTDFCNAFFEDFSDAYQSDYEERINGIALKAWEVCVENTDVNKLFMSYRVDSEGRFFRGRLFKTANTSGESSRVTSITAVGDGKDSVSCNIAGKTVRMGAALESALVIASSPRAIACEKIADTNVSVTINTAAGALSPVDLPSSKTVEQVKLRELEQKLALFATELEDNIAETESLSGLLSDVAGGQRLITYGEEKLANPSHEVKVVLETDQKALLIASHESVNSGAGNLGELHIAGVTSEVKLNNQLCSKEQSLMNVWDGKGATSSVCVKSIEPGTHRLSAKAYPSKSASSSTSGTLTYLLLPLRE